MKQWGSDEELSDTLRRELFTAEVGDSSRFASADSLAAAAGIAPVLRSSGAKSHQRRARRNN